nr:PREDICTED: G-protein coupled receptor family C group 6 member A-like [Latimeria chalumnae]|eukprot:XP_014350144.1 PREDICTED: G-protein coupled receptor family C group 6 member A-like [Latimeria chalumnae]
MIYSIEMINNSSLILPDVKLGYKIFDTCADATTALKAVMKLTAKGNASLAVPLPPQSDYINYVPSVKAVLGEANSEISIVAARFLTVPLMPQISYSSTSEVLSEKSKFPSFFRTVPSDLHQSKAMAKLAEYFNWSSVGAIGSDDEYGKYGIENFVSQAEKLGLCVAFYRTVPSSLSHENLDSSIDKIMHTIHTSSAEAIVLFTKDSIVKKIFHKALEHKEKRIWIASDAWATSKSVAETENIQNVGTVLGFSLPRRNIAGFEKHVQTLTPIQTPLKYFLKKYLRNSATNYAYLSNTSIVKMMKYESPEEYIRLDQTYSIYLAVNAFAHALHKLLNCSSHKCNKNFSFPPWKLLEELKTVSFPANEVEFKFDSKGDSTLGYEILVWNITRRNVTTEVVGEYIIPDRISINQHIKAFTNITRQLSVNCSKSCPAGYKLKKKSNPICCYECDPCKENTFSKGGNATECSACNSSYEWAPKTSDKCMKRIELFFGWSDGFAITLATLAAIGILIILVIMVIFTVNLKTPVVKGAGGILCYVMLSSLLISFCSVGLYIGKPKDAICKVRQPLFGISFSLCFSSILANLFQIYVGFTFDKASKNELHKFNKPLPIIVCGTAIQVVICTIWLVIKPSSAKIDRAKFAKEILHKCEEGSFVPFGVMLGYIALLALVCFLFTFKGRHLPDLYKNGKFNTISMLIYLSVWMCFVPVFISTDGKYVPAVETVAILASNYSILCCHFFPKCYIIFFRKEINKESAITEYIRKHFENKGLSVVPQTLNK